MFILALLTVSKRYNPERVAGGIYKTYMPKGLVEPKKTLPSSHPQKGYVFGEPRSANVEIF